MHVLAAVAYSVPESVSLAHSCSVVAEDEHSDSVLVACLAAAAAEVALPGSALVPDSEELLVSVVGSYPLGLGVVGNP